MTLRSVALRTSTEYRSLWDGDLASKEAKISLLDIDKQFNGDASVPVTSFGYGAEVSAGLDGHVKASLDLGYDWDSGDFDYNSLIESTLQAPTKVKAGTTFSIDPGAWTLTDQDMQVHGVSIDPFVEVELDAAANLHQPVVDVNLPFWDPAPYALTGLGLDFEGGKEQLFDLNSEREKYSLKTVLPSVSGSFGSLTASYDDSVFTLGAGPVTFSAALPDPIEMDSDNPGDVVSKDTDGVHLHGESGTVFSVTGDMDEILLSLIGLLQPELAPAAMAVSQALSSGVYVLVSDLLDANPDIEAGFLTRDELEHHQMSPFEILLDETILDLKLSAGLKLYQDADIRIDSIDVMITDPDGHTQVGKIGDSFSYTAPDTGSGALQYQVSYNVNYTVHSEIGLVETAKGTADLFGLSATLDGGTVAVPGVGDIDLKAGGEVIPPVELAYPSEGDVELGQIKLHEETTAFSTGFLAPQIVTVAYYDSEDVNINPPESIGGFIIATPKDNEYLFGACISPSKSTEYFITWNKFKVNIGDIDICIKETSIDKNNEAEINIGASDPYPQSGKSIALKGGGFIVAWTDMSLRGNDTFPGGVYGQIYDDYGGWRCIFREYRNVWLSRTGRYCCNFRR